MLDYAEDEKNPFQNIFCWAVPEQQNCNPN